MMPASIKKQLEEKFRTHGEDEVAEHELGIYMEGAQAAWDLAVKYERERMAGFLETALHELKAVTPWDGSESKRITAFREDLLKRAITPPQERPCPACTDTGVIHGKTELLA